MQAHAYLICSKSRPCGHGHTIILFSQQGMCNIFSKVTCLGVKDPGMGMKTKKKTHLIFHARTDSKRKKV
jgi:hypothetical protein